MLSSSVINFEEVCCVPRERISITYAFSSWTMNAFRNCYNIRMLWYNMTFFFFFLINDYFCIIKISSSALLIIKLNKKEWYRGWEQGQMTCEVYRDIVWAGTGVKKARAHLDLNYSKGHWRARKNVFLGASANNKRVRKIWAPDG